MSRRSKRLGILAQFGFEQAFGVKGVANVDGSKAQVWTAQQANSLTFRASPVFVCQDDPCTVGFIETGYVKGLVLTGNILKAYSTWEKTNGVRVQKMDIQNLNDNTWYDFVVWYKNGANPRWIVKIDGVQVYTPDHNIPDWIQGDSVGCGAEGGQDDIAIAVHCANMQYRPIGGAGVWTLYNYDDTQLTPGYAVFKWANWGALGQGPGF